MAADLEISCGEVSQILSDDADMLLLDCRETEEHAVASISAARLLPMSELAGRVGELQADRERQIVVMCHHGMRSAQVAVWLRGQGFADVQSMAGGIDRWSQEVDSNVPRY